MAEPLALRYRAFISYSHADTSWAKWLHRALESFRIDRDLVGRETGTGTIPKALRPIFRDRDDFTAGHTLSEQTLAALDASHALIAICSPHAAKSHYVTEEIRLFKSRHPDRPVIPLIVDGTPGDPERECFPPALKFKLDRKGQVTRRKAELLAADAREQGDGKSLSLAKVVAGLLGVSSDDIFRRAERDRRRKGRIKGAIAAGFLLLIGLASVFAYFDYQKRQMLADIEALVAKYSVIGSAEAAVPETKKSLTEAITSIAEGAARDPRYATALALLKAGKPQEAEPLLEAVAKDKAARFEQSREEAAGAYRHLGSIAGIGDPKRARAAYAKALDLDPDDAEAAYWYGYLALLAGDLDGAERTLDHLMELSTKAASDRGVYRAHLRLGEIALARGDLSGAMDHEEKALATALKLTRLDPGNPDLQRDLWAAYDKIGDLFKARGDLSVALERFEAGLGITSKLAEAEPGNAERERDLSTAYIKVGDAQSALGDFSAALGSYRSALAIREEIAVAKPETAGWQRDISVAQERIGDTLMAQDDRETALENYRAALVTRDRLAKIDPANAGWQRDLSVSQEKVGDLLRAEGDLAASMQYYLASLAIRDRLVELDSTNSGWQRDLSVTHNKIGDVAQELGDLDDALERYRASFAIREQLAKIDADSAVSQADLAASYARLAQIKAAQGDKAEALRLFRAGRAIVAPLAERSGSALWRGYVERFDGDIAGLEE
jgi:tetratricopeptide (TPR) repeat protein